MHIVHNNQKFRVHLRHFNTQQCKKEHAAGKPGWNHNYLTQAWVYWQPETGTDIHLPEQEIGYIETYCSKKDVPRRKLGYQITMGRVNKLIREFQENQQAWLEHEYTNHE